MPAWKEATAPDGRKYWYHSVTKKTTWEKPADAEQEPAVNDAEVDSAWKEAKAQDGKSYYYNSITNKTTWEPPEAFLRLQQQQQSLPPQRPTFVAGSAAFGGEDRRMDQSRGDQGLPPRPGAAMPWEGRQETTGFRGAAIKSDEPEYGTPEQAEEAFFKLLKRCNVTQNTPWIEALKLVAKEREYRAIKEPKERKEAFEKYIVQVREQEKEKEKERKEKMREDFKRMLTRHDQISHATRWKTARPSIEHEPVFKQAGDDEEFRKQMFNEYVLELRKQRTEQEVASRRSAIDELEKMVSALIVDSNTAWSNAQSLIDENIRYGGNKSLKAATKLDILNVYDKHIKELDRIANDKKQKQKSLRSREARKNRESFNTLLEKLHDDGKIIAGSKWTDFYPQVKDEPVYDTMLGNPGSDPLSLFWDVVEVKDRAMRGKRNLCLDVLEDRRIEIDADTTLDEFKQIMMGDERTDSLTDEEYSQIFDRFRQRILRRVDDEKKDAERQHRKTIDALRSIIKHLDPPLRGDDTYEDIEPKLAKHREFQDLDDESRRTAFDKQIRRVREREDDEKRRRDDRDRARDRRHRTRTPEADAYEADRRKAQADRERHYKGVSNFGLSPVPRDRRSIDSYDDRYMDSRSRYSRRESVYERERREREMERERNYVSRADPRDKGRSLDYGDEDAIGSGSRPGSVRKRRDSDDGSTVDRKRSRNVKTPETMDIDAKEEVALQSGSEEGEIEEV
ncbi:hypothetical protein K431DRAFT_302309 [Polychaeton citri CBS 116435]|uniref:Formin binding protein n=1 Tax=Polychaeton citri CBS 116435 TaxID=1314669 RepID=A0A9P4UQE5_9PEZI|nr:hypothetical protein K431DRAFT_302309 [Polychaeton citri CBS 116435]